LAGSDDKTHPAGRTPNAGSLLKLLLFVVVALLIPAVPFLLLGDAFEQQVHHLLGEDAEWSPGGCFAVIVTVLATDILLPIPSSAVSTAGGAMIGVRAATLASWLGMTVGAMGGFGLARLIGTPLLLRLTKEADRERTQQMMMRYGRGALVLTRPVPLFAEACVLLTGAGGMPWRRFLPPVLVSNLVISAVYSAIGDWSQENDTLATAVIATVLLPVAAAFFLRRAIRSSTDESQ